MKQTPHILLSILLLFIVGSCRAQVSGSDTVCAGYIYTYDATIVGADSFSWSFPSGWVLLSGEGTSHVEVLCTQWVSQVCAEGFDTSGNFIAQYCHAVAWGDAGPGWDVQLTVGSPCPCPPYSATVVPNGSGVNCGTCGNGIQSPNLAFAIYDDPWPNGYFVEFANGVGLVQSYPFTRSYVVYLIDTTFGLANAILIEGDACEGTGNHSFTISACTQPYQPITAIPDPVCIGDTLHLQCVNTGGFNYFVWTSSGNVTFLPSLNLDYIDCIINAPGIIDIYATSSDNNGCLGGWSITPNYTNCIQSITGDSVVCSGYTYSYSANIPGAVTYNWTFPNGWYDINGQGSSSVTATCNVSDGNVCVEGFDANSVSVGTECITTQWGGGSSAGWDIYPSAFYYCSGQPRDVMFILIPNGSGGGACPPGCGNGSLHANQIYGIYENNTFMGEVNNGSYLSMPPVTTTYHVYLVDTTYGSDFPDAIQIEGGCGAAANNNTVTTNEVFPPVPQFIQFPDPVCLGDTAIITQIDNSMDNSYWSAIWGVTILSQPDSEQIVVLVNSPGANVFYSGLSQLYYCNSEGSYSLNTCVNLPSASFYSTSDTICPGSCVDFTNTSQYATSYQWFFPGATNSTSTNVNPTSICYNTPGTYDVTLIAANTQGRDTLLLTNYIHVQPFPPALSINQLGDTLFAPQIFVTYQWYYNGNVINGATNYFYVAQQNGDYWLTVSDSNGCEVEAVTLNVITSIPSAAEKIISVWPNPAKDELRISGLSQAESTLISIYTLTGQKILSALLVGEKVNSIDIAALEPGFYILESGDADTAARARFIKQ